ncbi:hypothetical protein DEJ49_21405 [Streptomyces venezuelae]|uniref:WXG100 family type VII secretion target n=1 Tax=Streptomyces venezuelae TaxID=54571 RepID=A0A5P2CK16_STRVZ|nr:hypothetical protein [Streptomyces venezuelae]QES43202.1 hypothetical protein DEJ49_21405 [Streptomyces venezuelae]
MSGSDLVVDFHLLNKSANQLSAIEKEFKNLDEWKDDVKEAVGASSIKDAMGDFVDNWDKNRKRLLGDLEEVGKQVEGTRDAFQKLEDQLSKTGKKKEK